MADSYYSFVAIRKADANFVPNSIGGTQSFSFDSFRSVEIRIKDGDFSGDANKMGGTAPGNFGTPSDYDQVLLSDIPGHSAGSAIFHMTTESVTSGSQYGNLYQFTIGGEEYLTVDSLLQGTYFTNYNNNISPSQVRPDWIALRQANIIACFTANTLIETSAGNKPVEDLRAGDLIATMDDGYQPIRWIGSTSRDTVDLAQNPKLKPIRIPAGALGGGLPKRDLTVSRQHRVLIRSKIAQRMFGAEEILIPAIKLVGLNGIEIVEDCTEVSYFHILFDKHQVIFSEDAPTESLFTGPVALQSVPLEARKEIETLFPEITEPDFVAESARLIPAKGAQFKQLVERHRKHGMPLLNG